MPWLGGEGSGAFTNQILWQGYDAVWPTAGPEQLGGPFRTIPAFGIPFLNTLILLTSGLTITLAHHALKKDHRGKLIAWLWATVALGAVFIAGANVSLPGVLLAVASGALASGLGYAVWYAALAGLTASRAATVQLSVPVIAAVGGVLLLSEQVTMRLVVASGLTIGGIWVVLAQRSRRVPGPPD